MKKWLTLLLAMLVMSSSVIPCCTGDDCKDEATSELPVKEAGNCSPFFACGSCTGFTSLTKNIQVPLPAEHTTTHYETVSSLYPSGYSPNFFQPPRTASHL